jgi:hypothetical protein
VHIYRQAWLGVRSWAEGLPGGIYKTFDTGISIESITSIRPQPTL